MDTTFERRLKIFELKLKKILEEYDNSHLTDSEYLSELTSLYYKIAEIRKEYDNDTTETSQLGDVQYEVWSSIIDIDPLLRSSYLEPVSTGYKTTEAISRNRRDLAGDTFKETLRILRATRQDILEESNPLEYLKKMEEFNHQIDTYITYLTPSDSRALYLRKLYLSRSDIPVSTDDLPDEY
jgi:hypothetical protein